jgi:PAS domain S-box-containing protein
MTLLGKFQKDKLLALSPKISLIVVLIIAALLFGVLLIWHYAESEKDRAIRSWQVRMNLVADNQMRHVGEWVEQQYSALSALADNASLQLYLTELVSTSEATEMPEEQFLKNLLAVTADKTGFYVPSANDDVPANIRRIGTSGIALLDKEGRIRVATKAMPPISGVLQKFVNEVPAGSRGMLDVYLGPGGDPTMAFLVPIFSIQGNREPSQQVGMVLGVRTITPLYDLLKMPAETTKEGEESILVRINGKLVEYLTPQADGTAPLSRRLDVSTPELDTAFAALRSDVFALKRDHQFNDVLVLGRKVPGTNWTLVHSVKAEQALAESEARRTRIVSMFALILVMVLISIIAAWRHGESVRYEEAARRYRKLSDQYKSQEQLLRLVSDNQPDPMYIVDEQNKYRFANMEASLRVGISSEDMIGKTMDSVLGPNKVKDYKTANKRAIETVEPLLLMHHQDDAYIQSKHIPITRVPAHLSEEESKPGVLIVEQDITEVMRAQEKQERILKDLVDTLVTLVDRHNPYASNHSARVAWLASGVAEAMKLEPRMVKTVEITGKLMNIGKILIPSELLTKKDTLKDEELKSIRDSIYASADFLEGIAFDGPVVETLRQLLECWDGSGPKGMKGEDILISARVVAAANAFIGMLSPRAYRPSLGKEKAIEVLMGEANKKFDRSVVAALINYIENQLKDPSWLEVGSQQGAQAS